MTLNAALGRLGFSSKEQTAHGFRTIADTFLNELVFSHDIIELQLARKERNKVRAASNLVISMRTGKTTKPAAPSRPFNAADHLRIEAEIAAYIEAMLEDGDARAVPIALRTVADAVGGMAALASKA